MYISPVLRWVGIDLGPQGPPSVLLWNWLAVVVLVAYVLTIEGRGLDSILLTRPSGNDLQWSVIFAGIAIAAQMVLTVTVALPPSEGLGTILDLPLPVIVAIVLTTSITEEVLHRGYVIERLRELTGRLWLGVSFSFIVFVIPHLTFFGWQWLVSNGVSIVLLYALYVWRRNLVACMTMHLLGNSLVLIPALGLG